MTFKQFMEELCKLYDTNIAQIAKKTGISRAAFYSTGNNDMISARNLSRICIGYNLEMDLKLDNKGQVHINRFVAMMSGDQVERKSVTGKYQARRINETEQTYLLRTYGKKYADR